MARICKVNDEIVSVAPNWTLTKKLNGRSIAGFEIIDKKSLTDIKVGYSVEFKDGSDYLFVGSVNRCRLVEDRASGVFYQINCIDNNSIAGRLLISETGSEESVSDIIKNKILPILSDDNVTEGNITNDQVLSNYTFNNIYVSNALDKLKDITGYNWSIDHEKKLNFFSNSGYPAPFAITETTRVLDFTKESSLTQYRNVQYLKAGKGKTSPQEDEAPTPEPDGVSRTFVINYQMADKPRIFINSAEISESDIGIKGVDEEKKWYFKYGENTITQSDDESVLTSTDTLEISYVGLYDILTLAENDDQIAERKAVEGGSGRYESIIQEESLTEADETLEYSEGLLNKYGELADVVTFKTYTEGLDAGQLINITRSKYNIDSEFLIDSVVMRRHSPDKIEYTIHCIDGTSLGGWEEFFKRLVLNQSTFIVNENETLVKLKKLGTEVISLSESVVVSSSAPENRIGYMTIGYSEVG